MFKKGRNFFDTTARPSHVAFDDGKTRKRTLPWAHVVEAHWDYDEPDTIHLAIGDWLIVISGHNIDPLYTAIDDHTLSRVRAHPEFADDRMHDDDSPEAPSNRARSRVYLDARKENISSAENFTQRFSEGKCRATLLPRPG
jgi:hypothetical protein